MSRRRLTALSVLCATGLTLGAVGATSASAAPATATATATNETLVVAWYATFLDRPNESAADAGVRYWMDMLAAGRSRQYVLGGILRSDEYSNRTIGAYYTQDLGRYPDNGAYYWEVQTTQHDMAYEWVEQNILASQEYYDVRASGRTPDYVARLYERVIGRFVDPASGEFAYWVHRYSQVDRLSFVRELWYTQEAVQARVAVHYGSILGRDPDAGGLAYWSGPERESDITTQVEIASTPEFFDSSAEA